MQEQAVIFFVECCSLFAYSWIEDLGMKDKAGKKKRMKDDFLFMISDFDV